MGKFSKCSKPPTRFPMAIINDLWKSKPLLRKGMSNCHGNDYRRPWMYQGLQQHLDLPSEKWQPVILSLLETGIGCTTREPRKPFSKRGRQIKIGNKRKKIISDYQQETSLKKRRGITSICGVCNCDSGWPQAIPAVGSTADRNNTRYLRVEDQLPEDHNKSMAISGTWIGGTYHICIDRFFQAYGSGNISPKYGLKYGTVPV